jgi:hypothetical protein
LSIWSWLVAEVAAAAQQAAAGLEEALVDCLLVLQVSHLVLLIL